MAKRIVILGAGESGVGAALLAKKQGYDVTGVFIRVWQPENGECTWKEERRDAMRVCAHLDIPFITLDLREEYKKGVVDYMFHEYSIGNIPNPDVMCNREVKFGAFWKWAKENGADYIATGHYAQNINNKLLEGLDKNKDQSYFLWTLEMYELGHILFPIGHLQKPELRKLAEKAKIPVYDKKDSQGVCFLGQIDMKEFLKQNIETHKGDVLDIDGNIIGEHDGAVLYALGERHGFTDAFMRSGAIVRSSCYDDADSPSAHLINPARSLSLKYALPQTKRLAPSAITNGMVSRAMPPST